MSAKSKIINGLIWTYLERFTAQAVSLIVTIILARLLTPTEYGMIAIVAIFTEISNVIVVNGFGSALVQKENTDSKDYSTVFYAGMAITLFLYGILFIFAPLIADFYNSPQLSSVLRVLGLQMPIASVNSVQQSYISKKMEFKKFFWATSIGTIISAVVGITMAVCGCGVWSLVAQLLTNRIVDTVVLSVSSGWRLTFEFSGRAFSKLFSYSWKITLASFLITLYDNVRGLVIGKKYSADDLAFYNKGRQFPNLISVNVNTSISKVLFPALSNEQKNEHALLSITSRAIKEGSFLLTPLLFGLAACAKPFVVVVLTEKWLPIVPFMQIMCVVYALQPLQTASIQVMKAVGRSGVYLKLEIIKKILNFAILLTSLFAFNSVFIVVVGALLAEFISTILNFPANKKLINYGYIAQLKDFVPSFALSFIMFISIYFCGFAITNYSIALVVQVIVGTFVYIFMSYLFKLESFDYTRKILKGLIHKEK